MFFRYFHTGCFVRLVVAVIIAAPSSSAKQPRSLHGTINIVLANKNGIIAVTDSRLSGGQSNSGRKLFRIDDHIVCTVAGQYSLPGPRLGSLGLVGSALLPTIVSNFAAKRKEHPDHLNIETMLVHLANEIAFTFDIAFNLNQIQDIPVNNHQNVKVTLAGYDNQEIRIAQISLTYSQTPGGIVRYLVSPPAVQTATDDKFIYGLGGIDLEADSILKHPERYSALDPAIKTYADAKQASKDNSLSGHEMLTLAEAIEYRTAFTYPRYVGGAVEEAVLEHGAITFFTDQRSPTDIDAETQSLLAHSTYLHFNIMDEPNLSGRWCISLGSKARTRGISGIGMVVVDPLAVFLVSNGRFAGCKQDLDQLAFTHTIFVGVSLIYSGSPFSILDKTNTINNSTLQLGSNVKENDPFVKEIMRQYPNLKVIRGEQP